mmetsp:Transcript_16002/g.19858  ORF Transcript_16002/g.19858 Transcript_16002/m.19858 type:complete len:126 (-) Transcript_16002:784-1161(-)
MEELVLVTNTEVLDCLKKAEDGVVYCKSKEATWVRNKVIKYIEENSDAKPQNQTKDKIAEFINEIKETFTGESELTRAEILQLINLAPKSVALVDLIIEECDTRLTDEQIQALTSVVETFFYAET